MKKGQRLIGDTASRMPINTKRLKLRIHPPNPYAQHQPAAAQFLDRRDLLRGWQRRPIGQDQDTGPKLNAFGNAREPCQRGQGVHITATTALGVIGRDGNVIGDSKPISSTACAQAAIRAGVDWVPILRIEMPTSID